MERTIVDDTVDQLHVVRHSGSCGFKTIKASPDGTYVLSLFVLLIRSSDSFYTGLRREGSGRFHLMDLLPIPDLLLLRIRAIDGKESSDANTADLLLELCLFW